MDDTDFLGRLLAGAADGSIPVIGEIKAYTPNNGDLLRDRSVEEIAEAYENAGLACLSVVTGHWFKGMPEMLTRVAKATHLPVLRKDFIVSKPAIERSKEMGASAVLLTKQLVSDGLLEKLSKHALLLGLTPFIEVGSGEEIETLRVDSQAVLAICNRDITVKETDSGGIDKSLALLKAAKTAGAGAIVSASAIGSAAEAKHLIETGFDGLLIGTAFLRAPKLRETLDEFQTLLSHSRIDNEKHEYRSKTPGNAGQNLRHDVRL